MPFSSKQTMQNNYQLTVTSIRLERHAQKPDKRKRFGDKSKLTIGIEESELGYLYQLIFVFSWRNKAEEKNFIKVQ